MEMVYTYCDGETMEEHTLTFHGMPNVKEVNAAGHRKFGYKFMSMTLTSVFTS